MLQKELIRYIYSLWLFFSHSSLILLINPTYEDFEYSSFVYISWLLMVFLCVNFGLSLILCLFCSSPMTLFLIKSFTHIHNLEPSISKQGSYITMYIDNAIFSTTAYASNVFSILAVSPTEEVLPLKTSGLRFFLSPPF